MRRRDKLYKRMKRSGRPNDTEKFQGYKHLVRRVTDRVYGRYLGDIIGINTTTEQEENSPLRWILKRCIHYSNSKTRFKWCSPFEVGRKDPLWRLWEIKCPKQTISVCFQPQIPGTLKFFSSSKTWIQELNDQGCNLPFQSSPYSQMPQIQSSVKGIEKLLKTLNPHKAAGPDQFKPIVLQDSPCRTCPYTASDLPVTWLQEASLYLQRSKCVSHFQKRRQVRPWKLSPDITHMCFVQSARTYRRVQLD